MSTLYVIQEVRWASLAFYLHFCCYFRVFCLALPCACLALPFWCVKSGAFTSEHEVVVSNWFTPRWGNNPCILCGSTTTYKVLLMEHMSLIEEFLCNWLFGFVYFLSELPPPKKLLKNPCPRNTLTFMQVYQIL